MNAILLVSFKKIRIYIIFVKRFHEIYYICYIVGIIEKCYNLLQHEYESAKYLLSIRIILIKIL